MPAVVETQATPEASTRVIAPLSSPHRKPVNAPFLTYGRPLYPFTVLDRKHAQLLPMPGYKVFPTKLHAIHALEEHALHQGYKLEMAGNHRDGHYFKCATGTKCRHTAYLCDLGYDGWSIKTGVEVHSHRPSLSIGVFHWTRDLTLEEIEFAQMCKANGRIKSVEEMSDLITASRKRLGSDVPLPKPSVVSGQWDYMVYLSEREASEEVRRSRLAQASSDPPDASAAVPPVASPVAVGSPLLDDSTSSPPVIDSSEGSPSTTATSPSSSLSQSTSAPAAPPPADPPATQYWGRQLLISPAGTFDNNLVNYTLPTYNWPLPPFVVLDPAKACLLPVPKQIFLTKLQACQVAAQNALDQGYELAYSLNRRQMEAVRLSCKGEGCSYQATVKFTEGRWGVIDNGKSHSHGVDLEIGVRRWATQLAEEEERFIKLNKKYGRQFTTMEESQAVIEESRRRLHSDIPMAEPSAYASLWPSRGRKRARVSPPETQTPTAVPAPAASAALQPAQSIATTSTAATAVVVPAPAQSIARLAASPPPSAPHTSSTNATVTAPSAPSTVSSANKDAFMRGLDEMVARLWPEGLQNPQSKIRAAVSAMLLDDQEQRQQQQQSAL